MLHRKAYAASRSSRRTIIPLVAILALSLLISCSSSEGRSFTDPPSIRTWAYRLSDAGMHPIAVRILLFIPDELQAINSVAYSLDPDYDGLETEIDPITMGRLSNHPGGVCYYFDFSWDGASGQEVRTEVYASGTDFRDSALLSLANMPAWPY